MATYAVGDIQGCYDELRALLDRIGFDPARDRLWSVGDLVNRGPHSLAVLRFFRQLGERAVVVLGNHDLHLLAVAAGVARQRGTDTLTAVLTAPDRDELLDWLRHRPVLHYDPDKAFAVLHAGLPPQWDLATAQARAHELEQALREAPAHEWLGALYGDQPDRWDDGLQGVDRLRFIVNCFTRLRYCTSDGRLLLKEKSLLDHQPPTAWPWFRVPGRRSATTRIICGHWSTLGYRAEHNVWALDSGCLWGGRLTALRVRRARPLKVVALDCVGYLRPGEE